jgi:hypothetical protein
VRTEVHHTREKILLDEGIDQYLGISGSASGVRCDLHDAWCVETLEGAKPVSRVSVGYRYKLRILPAPISSVKQYSSVERPLMELVSAKTEDASFKVEANVRLNRPLPTFSKKQKKR